MLFTAKDNVISHLHSADYGTKLIYYRGRGSFRLVAESSSSEQLGGNRECVWPTTPQGSHKLFTAESPKRTLNKLDNFQQDTIDHQTTEIIAGV